MRNEANSNSVDHGDTGRGFDNIDPVENLLGDDPDEAMQTGYSPPDREPRSLRDRPTLAEQQEGIAVDEYLAEEEPDVDADEATSGVPSPRAGRLVTGEEHGEHQRETDGVATDPGPAGYASTAEEAAVHVTDDEPDRGPSPASEESR